MSLLLRLRHSRSQHTGIGLTSVIRPAYQDPWQVVRS